ncbi:MAG: M48 family metalloprotease [Gammaproteobacteria bacterium]
MKKSLLLFFIAAIFLGGCAVNPVTGKNELSLVSEQQEINIGKTQYSPMRQAQGGDLTVDRELTAYVSEVGQKLAAVSDRKLPYEFKVLNSSVPNAWALPGGKIVINRGLLTELNSEAELAAVLGHEITHAAAKHGARSMSRGMLLQGAMMATVIAAQGKDYAQLAAMGASVGGQLINKKYGRDAERESDHYGMIYMSRVGYDPQGAVDLQKTFVRLSEGKRQDWLTGLFASHPPSPERVQNNIIMLAQLPKGGDAGVRRYQQKIARLKKNEPAYEAYDKARKTLADGDTGQAANLVRKAIRIEPGEGHFHALLGDIEKKKQNPRNAKRHYDKALSLNDGFFYYYLQRGLVNEALGSYSAAQSDLDKSVKLLPTAGAYNALGNLARTSGNRQAAVKYYSKAAADKGATGKSAYGSLVEMDLKNNPGKYIKVKTGLDKRGRLKVQLTNTTPRAVNGMVVALKFKDKAGLTRSGEMEIRGTLKGETSKVIDLDLRLSREQLPTLQSTVIEARVVK